MKGKHPVAVCDDGGTASEETSPPAPAPTGRHAPWREATLLSRANDIVAEPFDRENTLRKITGLFVPEFCDWCFVEFIEPDGGFIKTAVAFADHSQKALAERLERRYPPRETTQGLSRVARSGRPLIINSVDDNLLASIARDDDHLESLRELRPRSFMWIPLCARAKSFGVITFVRTHAERTFDDYDLLLARDVAQRTALAIDNASLYEELLRDQAETRLREERYRTLVLASPSPMAVGTSDPRGYVVEDSPSWRDLTGQSHEEMKGRGWLKAIHPDDRERVERTFDHAIRQKEIYQTEFRLRMRDGLYRWFASKGVPILNADRSIREWVGTATDVDERKSAEEHLRFLSRASELLASSLDFDATLENITSLAVPALADWALIDIAGRESDEPYRRLAVAHVDPAKVELAWTLREKYPPDPEKDRILKVIQSGHSELITEITEDMLRAISRDEEHYQILSDLGIVSWMVVPLRLRNRSFGAVTFVSSDSKRLFTNTDLAHAEEFARQASSAFENSRLYSEMQRANQAKDEFLATLSHELRTPMTAILGWARLLGEGALDEVTYATAVEAIERSAKIQAALIDDVLDMSRITTGKMRLDVRMVDLAEIAEAALATVEPAATAKGIGVEFQKRGTTLVTADPNRLQQVIWNLVSNAIKFTPRGGEIKVRVEQVKSQAQVTVDDTGQGFAPEFGPHLFEPFRQAENVTTRAHGGLGLGLSIVRYLVEQHGGTVTAESGGVGKGATFRVKIPLRAVRIDDRAAAGDGPVRLIRTVDGHAPCRPAELDGLRILFVDDQEDARNLFHAIVTRCGAEAVLTDSVQSAMEAFQNARFDLVVTDIAMPGRDGYELIAWLNEQPERSRIRLIAMTAFGGPSDRDAVLAAGCDDYLKKPVEPSELVATIARVSGREAE